MKVFVDICFNVIVKDEEEAERMRCDPKMTPEAWLKLREQQAPNFPDEGVNLVVNETSEDDDDYWTDND
jgi:hypothetical protein